MKHRFMRRRRQHFSHTTTESTGLFATWYVGGEQMIDPLIEWAKRLGYGYTISARVEEGNPNIQVVFQTVRPRRPTEVRPSHNDDGAAK